MEGRLPDLLRLTLFPALSGPPEREMENQEYFASEESASSASETPWWMNGDRLTLGRGDFCDLQIPGQTVSRLHCQIDLEGSLYLLRDHSRNGTWVNGQRVESCPLSHGDWIKVGEACLRVSLVPRGNVTDRLLVRRTLDPVNSSRNLPFLEIVPSREDAGVGALVSSQLPVPFSEKVGALEEPSAQPLGLVTPLGISAGTSPPKAYPVLQEQMVIRGLEVGSTLQFWENRITFGRWNGNQVPLEGEKISRIHAALTREDGAYYLLDLESTNGTFVNEQRITRCGLQSGDRLRMGNHQARVSIDHGDCLLHFQKIPR
jgi:pSer/pThr/pTyr-binding forkhead associated (FHA) protein